METIGNHVCFCFEAGIQTWTLEWVSKVRLIYVQRCPVLG